jgi:hypothetical protein
MTEGQLMEIACAIILDQARDVEGTAIRDYLREGPYYYSSMNSNARQAAVAKVSELISKATITIEFPEASR